MKLTWIFRALFLFLFSSSSLMLYSLAQSICIAFSLFLIWDLSCWHSDVTPAKNIMRILTLNIHKKEFVISRDFYYEEKKMHIWTRKVKVQAPLCLMIFWERIANCRLSCVLSFTAEENKFILVYWTMK